MVVDQNAIRIANTNLLQVLTKEDVTQQLRKWKDQKSSMMNYLHRVETISPSGSWRSTK